MKNHNRVIHKNYHIVSPISSVDASLFASSSNIYTNKTQNNSIARNLSVKLNAKEKVKYICRTPILCLRKFVYSSII